MDPAAEKQEALMGLVYDVLIWNSRDSVLALLGAVGDMPSASYLDILEHLPSMSKAAIGDSLQLVSLLAIS